MTLCCAGFGPQHGPSNCKALHLEEWRGPDPSLPPEINVRAAQTRRGHYLLDHTVLVPRVVLEKPSEPLR